MAKRRRMFIPGVDRTGGFYNRFGGGRPGSELKFFDVNLDDAVVAAGSNIVDSVNEIPQGVTESQRIGRTCRIKSIFWRFFLTLPTQDAVAVPPSGDAVRVIMYLDKQCNGAVASSAVLLTTATIESFRNLAENHRFVFLFDRVITVNYRTLASDGAAVVSSNNVRQWYTMYKKCDIPIEYNSTTGAITEIRSNNIGVNLVGNGGIAGFSSNIRLRFSDT